MATWGWTTDTQANDYFADRLASSAYTGASAGDQKASMMTAYWRLIDCKDYSLTEITPTSSALRRAQCEMAYYLLKHLQAEDHRLGIRIQGVIDAGIVQEKYKHDVEIPIPPIVDSILEEAGYKVFVSPFHVAAIGRDDNLDIDEKITEYSSESET